MILEVITFNEENECDVQIGVAPIDIVYCDSIEKFPIKALKEEINKNQIEKNTNDDFVLIFIKR